MVVEIYDKVKHLFFIKLKFKSIYLYYLYNWSNVLKFNIHFTLLADNPALIKLFKYKILQLNNEENNLLNIVCNYSSTLS